MIIQKELALLSVDHYNKSDCQRQPIILENRNCRSALYHSAQVLQVRLRKHFCRVSTSLASPANLGVAWNTLVAVLKADNSNLKWGCTSAAHILQIFSLKHTSTGLIYSMYEPPFNADREWSLHVVKAGQKVKIKIKKPLKAAYQKILQSIEFIEMPPQMRDISTPRSYTYAHTLHTLIFHPQSHFCDVRCRCTLLSSSAFASGLPARLHLKTSEVFLIVKPFDSASSRSTLWAAFWDGNTVPTANRSAN